MSSRRLLASLGLAAAAGAFVPAAPRPAEAGKAPNGRETPHTFEHGGRLRSYLVHDFSKGQPAPLVLVLHGGGGDARNAVEMTGFDRIGARERLVVIYPNGTAARQGRPFLTWNAGHCCASAMRAGVDDVGFLTALIDRFVASGQADPARVFVTGMSNGGMMAHRLARERSDRVAALAPVVGAVFGDEPPARGKVAALVIVGAEDDRVPPEGGPLRVAQWLGGGAADRPLAPAIEQARYWARVNQCEGSKTSDTAASRRVAWQGCRDGADVVFESVAGNGHAWPGGRPGWAGAAKPTPALDATAEIWRFFAAHPRRPRSIAGRPDPE